jgi:3-oxoacyl-[acyl-carrier protein] reductase
MKANEFNDKVVVVTGGGMGLGQAYCRAFSAEGATVVCPDRNEEAARATVDEIVKAGGKAHAMKVDVTNADQVAAMVEEIIGLYGKIDVLVNNVGYLKRLPLLQTPEDVWDAIIDINLKSAFLVTKAVAPHMIKRNQGKIINLSSVVGLTAVGSAPYSAAKSGMTGLTRIMALELSPYRINVNCVAPGFIRTPGSSAVHNSPLGKKVNAMVPLGTGDTQCVVPVILFLSSSGSDYITGQVIVVDGGFSASHDLGDEFRTLDLGK